jgi:YD repeat-containing protein
LSWTASTDNVGVTAYLIESCSGTSCTSFAQIGTSTTTTYSANGLTAATAYSFRVRATDAAGNLSSYSATSTGTTLSGGGGDTTPPTAPSSPAAGAVSSTQINLTWTASTDNVGVTGYLVERCSGTSCTTFSQVGTATTTSYSDTGLTASTSYSYRLRATDAAGNLSSYSSTASANTSAAADTTPPTAPTNLNAAAGSGTQISLNWAASTDNVGVTGYLVERCQGSGCTSFTQIGTPTATSYSDTGLTASTSYGYRVRATDAAGNLSSYSTVATATTSSGTNTYGYDANGRLTTITTTNGTVHYTYDAAGHVTAIAVGP